MTHQRARQHANTLAKYTTGMNAPERLSAALSGRYTISNEIGHGGMATVYLAHDIKHGREVAIKLLRPELAQAVGAERFLREVNIAATLQSPHVLPLLESGEVDGLLYYVMPFVRGQSLRGVLAERGTLPPNEAMRLLRDVVDGLAHAHRNGVVHRDVKPDNVMVAERHAVVMDFGVAKAMGDSVSKHSLTSIGFSLGTPAYMAPEQAAADPNVDARADIYAVGVMAYELLSGAPPFTGAPQTVLAAHISTAPEPLQVRAPNVPPAIARLVMRCLEKEPAKRFQSADELLQEIESLSTPTAGFAASPASATQKRRGALIAAAVVVVAAAVTIVFTRPTRAAWVASTGLPEMHRLVEAGEQDSAFSVALAIDSVWHSDSAVKLLPPFFVRRIVLQVDPKDAQVCRASFADTTRWHCFVAGSNDSVLVPNRGGLFRVSKAGYRTTYRAAITPSLIPIDKLDAPHPEMERIAGDNFSTFLVGAEGIPNVKLGEFLLDRFEVTNKQYKAFVDAGGYRDSSYWQAPFRDGTATLSFTQAMARFVDRTGRPSPSTWESGDFPAGQAEYPVSGVSWYEAAAYARFAKKSLPTVFHWAHAASIGLSKFIVPLSNLEGKGPLPVGTLRGVALGGVSDMAGNVREWCLNASESGDRFILGGGWSDPKYAFTDAYAQPPMNRAEINGIRLALYGDHDSGLAKASATLPHAFTDYAKEKPVTDAMFASFPRVFDYDPVALNAKVESRDTTSDGYNVERVSFDAAYGKEREYAWVYTPKQGRPPYQSIVFFPGSGVIGAAASTSSRALDSRASWALQTGRAVVVPIYKSTFERSDSLHSDIPDQSIFWRDHVVMWVKDYKRTLDYLSTRKDFDSTRFVYEGLSWGGNMAPLVLASEPRLKAAILYVAGLTMERGRPEVDPFNYLPRVRQPVLMLNGRYDFFFPVRSAQEPFFRNLGAPAADRKYIVYEGGHDVPRTELIREGIAWLDKYVGPVK